MTKGVPSKRMIKRPRGRPPKDAAKRARYREASVRLREDGAPVKPAVRLNPSELESWLVAHAAEFWHGRGRPPAGQQSWATAAMKRFDISRSTLLRLVAAINRRRERVSANASAGLDPAQASLLAALADSYRNAAGANASAAARGNAPAKINRPQAVATQGTTTSSAGSTVSPLRPEIHPADVRAAVLAWLHALSDPHALQHVQELVHARLAALGAARPYAAAAGAAGARGMEAIGLRVVAAPARPAPPVRAAGDAITESLLEAMDAAESMGALPPASLALVKQLRQQLGG